MTDPSPHLETLKRLSLPASRRVPVDTAEYQRALAFAIRAIEERDELRDALRWLLHIGHGVGKAGGAPDQGEFESAMNAGTWAIAKTERTGAQ